MRCDVRTPPKPGTLRGGQWGQKFAFCLLYYFLPAIFQHVRMVSPAPKDLDPTSEHFHLLIVF